MARNEELRGKTFDQQVEILGKDITNANIAPNRRVAGEIVFEPMGNGVRVTARDDSHKVLWGFVASKGMLDQTHCLVAVYDTLVRLIVEELKKRDLPAPEHGDPVKEAERTIAKLEETIKWLKKSLQAKQQSKAGVDRVTLIARITSEAYRQISLDAEMLKGMKSKSEPDPSGSE